MVAVNPFLHETRCSGMHSLRLVDIKDELDIQNNISTERASRLTAAISRGSRRGCSHGSDPPLQRYLTSIGYENPYVPQDVSSVLTLLLGPSIVEQLRSFPSSQGSEQSEVLSITPDLLASKTKGDSEFELTETKSAATSARVNVSISKSKPIQFKSHTVRAASFEVCHAKSTRMKLQLKVDLSEKKTQSVDISKHLTLEGSCGQTLADYVASLQCDTSTWLSARKISVGEILSVLLHEKKAIHVVQSLPLFFSLQLSEWSVNHYLTTAVIRDNGTVEEAHIYVKTPIELHPLLSEKVKLCINTLVVHIFPGHESHDQGIQIKGECTINGKHTAKLSCQCGSDLPNNLCVVFSGSLAASDIFHLLDVKTTPNSLRFPFTGGQVQDNVMYSIGFNMSQILPNTTTAELESVFFKVDGKFNCFLPPPLNEIEAAEVHTTIHYPFTASQKVGLTASFVFKLEVPSRAQNEKATVLLDCYFSATPAAANEEYTFNVTVLPFYRPQQLNQSIQGPAVFDIISALSTSMGSQIAEELDAMLTIRNQILKHIVMKKLALQISSTAVFQAIELEATASNLDIVPHKLQIQSGTLKLKYSSENGLQLECSGIFTFLEHFTYSVTIVIPTSDTIGEIHFMNYDDNLTLNKIVEAFEWFSPDIHSHPIVSSVLDITLKKVDIYFSQNLEITQAELSLTKKELSIGIMTFTHVEVSVMLKKECEQYTMSFSIGAFIGDTLYAELQYSPESHLLTGRVSVTCFSNITGPDTLKSFQLESSDSKSFEHMNSLLCKQFMDVFHSSQNQQEAGPGLTAFIDVSISIPSKRTGKYALEHLSLEVKDALKIRSYILDTFRFEYSRTPFGEDASTIQLLAIVRKLGGTESMVLKFDLAAVTKQASIFTATVKPGPQGSLLKLSSVLDLADCKHPDLPKVDLPPVFDFELKYGSVSFALSPFQVHEFDVAILIQHWQVFQDPELTVHNLTFRTTWKSGSLPELILTDCLLTFLGLKLALNGRITPKAVSIECKDTSSEEKESSKVVKFESVLKKYSPSTLPSQPVIPKDVGLPPMNVKLKELALHLQEKRKSLRLNTNVTLNNSWSIDFGSRPLSVNELGAALEWEKNNGATTYRAFIYGSFQLCTLSFEVQMALGNNIDSIIVARISCPENLPHFGEVADYLLCPTVPNSSEESSIDSLVPPSMKRITPLSISMAMNVTKKQFFLSGKVDRWGSGYLLVGHLRDPDEMDYVVSLALEDGFRFSQLSESLKFIDEFVTLRCVNLLVSSIELKRLSDIIEPYDQALNQLGKNLQTPFSTLPALGSSEFTSKPVGKGTTLYAAIDINSCRSTKGVISNVFQLGDESLTTHDLIIMVHICSNSQTEAYTKVEFHAWIQRLKLFQVLVFSDIHLLYKLHKPSGYLLELCGRINLELDITSSVSNITFEGQLSITDEKAFFRTHSGSRHVVKQPAGINVEVRDLKLELVMDLRSGSNHTPDLFISGGLTLGPVHLTARFLLKGITFKVFHIKLDKQMLLSLIFERCGVEWTASSLDIGIKQGEFYYARTVTEFIEHDGMRHCYEEGYHLESIITLLNTDFRIKADIPHDRKMLSISGRSVQKIDFGFAKLTGTGKYLQEGPELSYSNRTLCFKCGVEILKQPWFEGSLKYCMDDKCFEGSIAYQGRILWIENPRMTIRWSKIDGFQIIEFPILGENPFELLGAIAKFAKVLYNLISGIFRWNIKLQLKTARNDNPEKYLVKFILTGTLSVTVIGFINIDVIPLPEIPLNLLRFDDFSLSKLPLYILRCLWDSAGEICKSLLSYLNPVNIAKMMGKMIINAVTGAIQAVVNVGKQIVQGVKKAWRTFKSFFGFSAFIIDTESNTIVGYICGGKGGKDLCDEEYIVTHFGPFLAVHAVEKIANDVHRNAKTCINVEKEIEDTDSQLGEEEHVEQQLDELHQKTQELSTNLGLMAGEILRAGNVFIEVVDDGLYIKWKVTNAEGKVYSEDKGDIEHHVKVVVTTVAENQDNEVCVESITIFDETLTRKDCTKKTETQKKTKNSKETAHSQLQEAQDVTKPDEKKTTRKKPQHKSTHPSRPKHKFSDESQTEHLGVSEIAQSQKDKKYQVGRSRQLQSHKQAHPDKQIGKVKQVQPDKQLGNRKQSGKGKPEQPDKQPENEQMQPDIQPGSSKQEQTKVCKDTTQSRKHKVTQSTALEHKNVEPGECTETKEYLHVNPEQGSLQGIESDGQKTNHRKLDHENTRVECGEGIAQLRDEGRVELAKSETTAATSEDHQHSTSEEYLNAGTEAPTNLVDVAADPEVEKQKWLEILVPLEACVLHKTVCVNVRVHPTVTLKVMTLPPHKSKHVDQEMLDRKDKIWMEVIKKEIKEEGREKEVTLSGEKVCKKLLTKPAPLTAVQFSTIDFVCKGENLIVFGCLTVAPEATSYLISIIDKSDQIVVIKQVLIPSDSHSFTLDFELGLHYSELPKNSQGPYLVAGLAVNAELSTCQSFTVSNIEIPRYPQPKALIQSLPKLNDLAKFGSVDSALDLEECDSEGASDIVRISWSPPQLEDELETNYSFVVNLVGTHFSEHVRREYHSSELTEDKLNTDEPTFTLSVPVSPSEHNIELDYHFSLRKIFERANIPLNSGLALQCEVVTVGSHPEATQHKLPSMPQLAPEFIVIAPPTKVSLSTPDTKAGLLVSWFDSIHAVSYRIDIVDEATSTAVLSKTHHCQGKDKKSGYDDFDTNVLLGRNELRNVPCSSMNSGYMLQIYSLGLGEELLRSLVPTVAGERLHMMPVEMKYLPRSDSIALRFNATPIETPYTVELYLEKRMEGFSPKLLGQIEVHAFQNVWKECQFLAYYWRLQLEPGSTLSVIVHSTGVVKNEGSEDIYLGVASTELGFLRPPACFHVVPEYEFNWTVSGITMNWTTTGELDTPHYEYGFISSVTGSVIFKVLTQSTSAVLDTSSLSLLEGCTQFKCFVESMGNANVITSNPNLDSTLYQCVGSPTPETNRIITFTSVSLLRLWGWYLGVVSYQNCLPIPGKPRHRLFPNGQPFPEITVSPDFTEKFWDTKSQPPLLFDNGK